MKVLLYQESEGADHSDAAVCQLGLAAEHQLVRRQVLCEAERVEEAKGTGDAWQVLGLHLHAGRRRARHRRERHGRGRGDREHDCEEPKARYVSVTSLSTNGTQVSGAIACVQ